MTQIDYQSAPQSLPFNSQRAGMIVFGIIFCLIGLFSFLGALFLPLAMVMQSAAPSAQPMMTWRMLVPMEIVYLVIAGFFVFLGIENFRARRWVRPICIVCGGLGFCFGLLGILSVAIQWSTMYQLMQNPGGTAGTPAAAMPGMWIGIAFAAVFSVTLYLILPGVIWWFYRRESVRETVYYFDPSPSWTDDLPLSVLTAAVVEIGFAMGVLFMIMYPVVPVFAMLVHGIAAVLVLIVLAAANLFTAILLIRLREIGWWLALILPTLQLTSQLVAVNVLGTQVLYDGMNMTEAQRAILLNSTMQSPIVLTLMMSVTLVVWVLFLVYIRPQFGRNQPALAGGIAAS